MRIFILFPIASFYVSRSRETNRQSSARVRARSTRTTVDPAQRDTPRDGVGLVTGPRRASFRLVLHRPTCGVAWGATCPGARRGGCAERWAARANPTRNSEAASRRSVFDRVPLLSDLKLCLLRSCQAPRAAPTLPLLRFWAGWGWGCGTSGCGCGMRLEGLGVALLRSSANLIT